MSSTVSQVLLPFKESYDIQSTYAACVELELRKSVLGKIEGSTGYFEGIFVHIIRGVGNSWCN